MSPTMKTESKFYLHKLEGSTCQLKSVRLDKYFYTVRFKENVQFEFTVILGKCHCIKLLQYLVYLNGKQIRPVWKYLSSCYKCDVTSNEGVLYAIHSVPQSSAIFCFPTQKTTRLINGSKTFWILKQYVIIYRFKTGRVLFWQNWQFE